MHQAQPMRFAKDLMVNTLQRGRKTERCNQQHFIIIKEKTCQKASMVISFWFKKNTDPLHRKTSSLLGQVRSPYGHVFERSNLVKALQTTSACPLQLRLTCNILGQMENPKHKTLHTSTHHTRKKRSINVFTVGETVFSFSETFLLKILGP